MPKVDAAVAVAAMDRAMDRMDSQIAKANDLADEGEELLEVCLTSVREMEQIMKEQRFRDDLQEQVIRVRRALGLD